MLAISVAVIAVIFMIASSAIFHYSNYRVPIENNGCEVNTELTL